MGVLSEHRSTPERPLGPVMVEDRHRAMWARMMSTADLTVYLAECDGEPIGTATLLILPNITYDCRPTAFIEAVVVKYGHRRRGVATRMVQQALDDARSASCYKVQLLSHKRHASDGAHALYATLGFRAEAEGFRLYLDGARGDDS
jgi:GNAT superfamily N-acetyltransferase